MSFAGFCDHSQRFDTIILSGGTMRKLIATSLIAFAACAAPNDADTKIIILHNVPPGEGCVVAATEGEHLSSGSLDVAGPRGYLLTPVLKNFAEADDKNEAQRFFFAEGADVSLSFTRSTQLNRDFSVRFNASVPPNGGLTAVSFEVMPIDLVMAARTAITAGTEDFAVASVSIFGEQAGAELVTRKFDFPIRVCNGCATANLGACAALPEGFEAVQVGGVCSRYQDGFVECCNTATGQELCPAEREESSL